MSRGRRWLELAVRPGPGVGASLVPGVLVDLGARGVVEEGAAGGEDRTGPEAPGREGGAVGAESRFVAYFEEPEDLTGFLREARAALLAGTGLRGMELAHRWQEHEAWEETWKRGLGPRRVTDRIVVHPSWAEPDDVLAGDIVIVVDPGMAFGTAEHATTRGCLRLLDRTLRLDDRVLDVGAGSGILSIAAALGGAREVTAVEGDPLACEALVENLRRNRVEGIVHLRPDWVTAQGLAALGPVDGVVANIETGLLLPLLPGLTAAVGEGGWLVVSGILEHEWEPAERELLALGFRPVDIDAEGEWRAGSFERLAGRPPTG